MENRYSKLTATQELSDLCALMQQTKHTKQHVLDSVAPTVQNKKHCCDLGGFVVVVVVVVVF